MAHSRALGLALSATCVAETAAICVPTIVDSLLGRLDQTRVDERLQRWAARVLDRAEIHLDVRGTIPNAGGPFVVMSNHASFLDIPVVYRLFGGKLRMVAKQELFRVPGFGRAMLDAGMVRVDRGNRNDAIKSLDGARGLIDRGVSIWIAPEGTRSEDGSLGPLKKGGFFLAQQTGRPILPITLRGTQKALPRGAWSMRRSQSIAVVVHQPIPVQGLPRANEAERKQSRTQLMAQVAAVLA